MLTSNEPPWMRQSWKKWYQRSNNWFSHRQHFKEGDAARPKRLKTYVEAASNRVWPQSVESRVRTENGRRIIVVNRGEVEGRKKQM